MKNWEHCIYETELDDRGLKLKLIVKCKSKWAIHKRKLSDGKTLILYSLFIADGLLSFEPLLVVCFYHLLIVLLVLVPPHINHMMLVVTRGRKVIPPTTPWITASCVLIVSPQPFRARLAHWIS